MECELCYTFLVIFLLANCKIPDYHESSFVGSVLISKLEDRRFKLLFKLVSYLVDLPKAMVIVKLNERSKFGCR